MAATRPPFFWVRYGLYRMGLLNIFGVLVAAVSVSALAADPPVPRGNVSVNLNPTTGYYSSTNSTLRLPNGVSVSPSPTSVPVVSKYSGGLQQTIPTGITIDAIKKSAPLPTVVRATKPSLNNAAKGLLRGNLASLVLGAGLNSLLDGIGAIIDEGGKLVMLPPDGSVVYDTPVSGSFRASDNALGGSIYGFPSASAACAVTTGCVNSGGCIPRSIAPTRNYCFNEAGSAYGTWALEGPLVCSSGEPTELGCVSSDSYAPPPAGFLDDAIDSSYEPEPSDWTNLTPYLDLDDVEITSAPTLQGNPKTTTVFDADGNPHKVTETNIWYDFDIRDNPSPRPALDMKTREETKTYENGELTSTTTTTSTSSGGSGGAPPPEVDIPIDCDFMPTVCAFLEWYRDDDPPEEPDLSALIDDRDFVESYTIHGGSKQCPPPYELTLSFIGETYYLSFDFACDFSSKIYFFVMAAAYIFAAYISVGVARNG